MTGVVGIAAAVQPCQNRPSRARLANREHDDCGYCIGVIFAHSGELGALLGIVVLVGVDLVNPQVRRAPAHCNVASLVHLIIHSSCPFCPYVRDGHVSCRGYLHSQPAFDLDET